MSNYAPDNMDVITYPCPNLSLTMLVEGTPGGMVLTYEN